MAQRIISADKRRKSTAGLLTDRKLISLKPGQWATEKWPRGEGRFQARKLPGGRIAFYYRYAGPNGQERIALPRFDNDGNPIKLADARQAARALAKRYMDGERDLKGALAREQAERDRLRAREQAKAEAGRRSFGNLIDAYCEALRKAGKRSHKAVMGECQRHIAEPFPELWEAPAATLETEDFLPVLERLTNADKFRTAAKIRSYVRAAYSAACNARVNAQSPQALRDFKLTTNPARDLGTIQDATRARDRALSVEELRAYWKRISDPKEPAGPLLRFHLLTGAQRARQLKRATVQDVTADGSLVIWDSKGKRSKPRRHVVPLIPEALEAMEQMASPRLGPFVWTCTNGRSGIDYGGIRERLKRINAAMIEAGEIEKTEHFVKAGESEIVQEDGEDFAQFKARAAAELGTDSLKVESRPVPFTIGDIRRTVETRLAAAGVSMDIRGQLQSHGLGGVQSKHYDKHGYLDEKRDALEKLHKIASAKPGKVQPIKAAKGRRA